jgi:opacity protein-like surface antigen
MRHIFIITACALFLLAALPLQSQEQNFTENVSKRGTTAASFLEIGVGARPLAMGGAFTALANDPSALYWNVAGIAKLNRTGIFFNHSEWVADINFDYLAGVVPVGRFGTLGISITALTMDEMDVTTVDAPEGTGQTFKAGDFAVSIGYALKLTDRFAIGFNPKFIYQSIWEMSATGFGIDVGVHYDTPFKNVSLGFSMSNFGTKMAMAGDNARVLHDIDPQSSGNNDRVTALLETSKWALPLNFKIGLVYKAFDSEKHRAYLAVDAQHPNNDYESVNAGVEYVFNKMFALRGGYKSLFLKDSEESFTLGGGINYPILGNILLHIDYAYADFGLLEKVQKFSIGLDF